MNLRSRNKVLDTFNMSSLTDIIFLLLIFFMLTSKMVSVNALNVLLPNSSAKTDTPQSVAVTIDKDIKYYIGKEEVSFSELKPRLTKQLEGKQNAAVVLNAERSIPWDEVIKVLNIGYEMNINMVVATKPMK